MSQRFFCILIGGLVGFSLSACAPKSTTSSSSLSSRGNVDDSQYKLAECNRIDISSMSLKGQISTYYSNGQLISTYLNSNLTLLPTEMKTSATHFIQLFRWSERVNGSPTTNSIPVTMYFVQKSTGITSNPNGSDRISKPTVEAIIANQKLGNLGITLTNFFERHFVVLTGVDTSWDAIRYVMYNGTTQVSSGSVLLPAFYANPNVYAKANSALSLQQLHPNYAYRSSNATESDYLSMTEQICSGFFSTYRVPASFGEAEVVNPDAQSNGTRNSSWFEMIREKFRKTLATLRLGRQL